MLPPVPITSRAKYEGRVLQFDLPTFLTLFVKEQAEISKALRLLEYVSRAASSKIGAAEIGCETVRPSHCNTRYRKVNSLFFWHRLDRT